MRALVTGAAGFIGSQLSARLIAQGHEVVGLDNLNDYYDPHLKKDRLEWLAAQPGAKLFRFEKLDLADEAGLSKLFKNGGFTHVVNLAAQAGVRYSLDNPQSYIRSNLDGFANLLECCRLNPVEHLVFASSSSVYGMNAAQPYSVHHNVDHPVSLYAATKKSNELMAHAYSHLFDIPATGLRFFTVYGPWGRPDMALFLFTKNILAGKPIRIFNYGKSCRDFTYINDVVEGVARIMPMPATSSETFDPVAPDPASSSAPWRIYNIGNAGAVSLEDFISELEDALGKKAIREYLPLQPGDVESTLADVKDFSRKVDFRSGTPLKDGIAAYVKWYKSYYG